MLFCSVAATLVCLVITSIRNIVLVKAYFIPNSHNEVLIVWEYLLLDKFIIWTFM